MIHKFGVNVINMTGWSFLIFDYEFYRLFSTLYRRKPLVFFKTAYFLRISILFTNVSLIFSDGHLQSTLLDELDNLNRLIISSEGEDCENRRKVWEEDTYPPKYAVYKNTKFVSIYLFFCFAKCFKWFNLITFLNTF